MKIAAGCDHRGYAAKLELLKYLGTLGHQVEDFGCHSKATVDYPDIAQVVAGAVSRGECEVGILISGSGMGMCMAADKVRGIRAAVVHDEFGAGRTREQHHCNILCLGADLDGGRHFQKIAIHFLQAGLDQGRYARRVMKLMQIEQRVESEFTATGI